MVRGGIYFVQHSEFRATEMEMVLRYEETGGAGDGRRRQKRIARSGKATLSCLVKCARVQERLTGIIVEQHFEFLVECLLLEALAAAPILAHGTHNKCVQSNCQSSILSRLATFRRSRRHPIREAGDR